jgi:hypothetical protein
MVFVALSESLEADIGKIFKAGIVWKVQMLPYGINHQTYICCYTDLRFLQSFPAPNMPFPQMMSKSSQKKHLDLLSHEPSASSRPLPSSHALPLSPYTPASLPIRKHQSSPCASLLYFDHAFPDAPQHFAIDLAE